MKKTKLPTSEQLRAELAKIERDPGSRGWKTAYLEQNADDILAAIEKTSYDQVSKTFKRLGVDIAPATLANWRKTRQRAKPANTVPVVAPSEVVVSAPKINPPSPASRNPLRS